MRWVLGVGAAYLILVIGLAGEASAACCVTVTHVYVPPTHVVVPHTYVHPVTPQVHPHVPTNTLHSTHGSTIPQVAPEIRKPSHRVEQPIVVNSQAVATSSRCKQQQGGDGCKKKGEELTGWAKVRHWLQLDKH